MNQIREGEVVYVRCRATRRATFFDRGVSMDGVSLIPLDADGTEHEYILAPESSVISGKRLEALMIKKVKDMLGKGDE